MDSVKILFVAITTVCLYGESKAFDISAIIVESIDAIEEVLDHLTNELFDFKRKSEKEKSGPVIFHSSVKEETGRKPKVWLDIKKKPELMKLLKFVLNIILPIMETLAKDLPVLEPLLGPSIKEVTNISNLLETILIMRCKAGNVCPE